MGTRRTNATQGALSQLQDNERIAMTLINNVVQKAGYFPDPVNQSLATTFVAETIGGVSMVPGRHWAAPTPPAIPWPCVSSRLRMTRPMAMRSSTARGRATR